MYDNAHRAYIATTGTVDICLNPQMANRHGLVAGATGTGKTVSLQTLAETFSQMGVPVFVADIKGDFSGVAEAGGDNPSVGERVASYGLEAKGFRFQSFPVQFWDVFGTQGIPVRATIADMGPLLFSRLLGLNETQTAVLTVVYKFAQDHELELVDLKDMQQLLSYVSQNAAALSATYGSIPVASIGAIQRNLISLEHQGVGSFFGEPALRIDDLMQESNGKGVINILAADELVKAPMVYSTFLLWLMEKLFTVLPEVGDMPRPKLVFFFDEAHLLFKDAPKILLEKVEQIVRLIRSKGVGIYFITQAPSDIPDTVLGQLGNRVQHALRAYTPKDQKALKAAAQTFRANPAFDTETAISALQTGEALLSFLDEQGAPQPVERGFILPPQGKIGPLGAQERQNIVQNSVRYTYYKDRQDRVTAYEKLAERLAVAADAKESAAQQKVAEKNAQIQKKQEAAEAKTAERLAARQAKFWNTIIKSIVIPLIKQVLRSFFKTGK